MTAREQSQMSADSSIAQLVERLSALVPDDHRVIGLSRGLYDQAVAGGSG